MVGLDSLGGMGGSGIGGDVAGIVGDFMKASGYGAEAKMYREAARLSLLSSNLKDTAQRRQIFQVAGQQQAAAAANGLKTSGSAADVIRSSTQQGYLQKAIINIQGRLDYNSYSAQAAAAQAQADASTASGIGGIFDTAMSVGSMFSDDNLKEDISLVHRRRDGIGIYRFRYIGTPQYFQGALASDVEKVRPEAVQTDEFGIRFVDYDMIGMAFKKVA